MILFKKIPALKIYLRHCKSVNKTIGFVPTMGALHKGHASLIEQSKIQNDISVCSIFINPSQFNNEEDFRHYPVTLEKDIELLEKINTDILFLPSVEEMYPKNKALPHFNLGYLENILEGKHRPGHFQGVCIIMHKLLQIIQPDNLYLGQKDYQQCLVIKKMLEITAHKTNVITVPTQREKNGLAMSSRNLRLSNENKEKAAAIHKALLFIKDAISKKPFHEIKEEISNMLLNSGFEKIDYAEIADAETLQPVSGFNSNASLVALIAAWIGGVRLIDNMQIN